MRSTSKQGARIFPFLLFLCYLEVLLWTSCLLISYAPVSAGEAGDSHNYLLREKGNLGLAAGCNSLAPGGKSLRSQPCWQLKPRLVEAQVRAEHGCLRRLQEASSFASPELLQPGLTTLRIFQEVSGLPAPYTGIKAIS